MNKKLLLILLGALSASPLGAQTNSASARTSANRYLLILETSHAMQKRADGVRSAVQDLLMSSMSGQLQPGDTLGFWTYNDELHAGQFPMQVWAPQTRSAVVARALAFLNKQTYEKQAALEKVLPTMDRLIKSSEFITVILISGGQQPMIGTPFDKQINDLHRQWANEEQKAHRPFITVLRARRGTITGYSVTPTPWPVEFPAFPPEPIAKADQQPSPQSVKPPAPAKKQSPPVPPLIISGKKIAAEKAEAASSANLSPPVSHPSPPSSQASAESAPAALPPLATQPLAGPPPAQTHYAEAPTRPSQNSVTAGGQSDSATSAQSPAAIETVTAPGIERSIQAPASPPHPMSGTPQANPPSPVVASAKAAPADIQTAGAPGSTHASGQSDSPSLIAASLPVRARTTEDSSASAPSQNAVALPSEAVLGRSKIWLAVFLLVGLAAALVGVAWRRARAASRASLITRSLDRPQK